MNAARGGRAATTTLLSLGAQREVFGSVAWAHGLDPLLPASWYQIKANEVAHLKGVKDILYAYKHSFVNALLRIFPEIGLDKAKLSTINATAVPLQEKQRLIRELALQLGYSSKYEDLYNLSAQKFRHNGLRHLILPYNDSAVGLITSSFPDHVWHEWCFVHSPVHLWDDRQIHKRYVEWLGDKLDIKNMDGWYTVSTKVILDNKGRGLLGPQQHYDSVGALMQTVYPQHDWLLWLFPDTVNLLFWKSSENCRRYLDWLGTKLGFKQQEDWYAITNKHFIQNKGKSLLQHFGGSAVQAVTTTYNTHKWNMHLLMTTDTNFSAQQSVLSVLEKVATKVNLRMMEEWYVVTCAELFSVPHGKQMYKYYEKNMLKILQTAYPDHQWDASKFLRNAKNKRQFLLETIVRELFIGHTILSNARKDAQLKFMFGKQPYMELDLYIPSLQLAFEYQDPHHYFFVWYASQPLSHYQSLDAMKAQAAREKGITIISVPFWWDGLKESLIGSIQKARSDLLPQFSSFHSSIPDEIPDLAADTMLKDYYVPGLGVPMLACPILSLDIVAGHHWWMMEKYDGIRAFWSPQEHYLLSRSGRKLQVPASIIEASFCRINIWLDGEIWFGYGTFDEAGKVAHKASFINWKEFRYIAFDAPTYNGTYKERYKFIQELLSSSIYPHIIMPVYYESKTVENMLKFTQDIINKGGEGVILRNPKSIYTQGRSYEFLKLKKFRDAEAKVIAITNGLYTCELPNKVIFSAPVELNIVNKINIQEQSIISFKHRGYTKDGIPKLPIIYRLRSDVIWSDLHTITNNINNFIEYKFSSFTGN